MKNKLVRIAIDGPGGAGKSSVSREIAKALGIIYVDTGALYRTIGLYMLSSGIDPKDKDAVCAALGNFTLSLSFENVKQVILLDGTDVGDSIRTPEVSMAASAVSAIPEVREYLLKMQRDTAKTNSVIMDGRDIGTVILPDAEVKIFLTASAESRAKRRYDELKARGKDVTYEQVYTEMEERDRNDSTRAVAPCVPAKDAVLLDNSSLDLCGTRDAILSVVKKKTGMRRKKQKKTAYMKARTIIGPVFRAFHRIRVFGLENLPGEGGVIVCCNHIAVKDVFLLGAVFPRQVHFIAKKELFRIPVLSSLIRLCGAIRIDRGGNDVHAIKTAISLAANGELVALFPQGHRYPGVNPADTPIKSGAGMIAYRSGCDVLPVCIKTKNIRYAFLRKIEIHIGTLLTHEDLGFETGGNEEYRIATERIYAQILALGSYTKSSDNAGIGANSAAKSAAETKTGIEESVPDSAGVPEDNAADSKKSTAKPAKDTEKTPEKH